MKDWLMPGLPRTIADDVDMGVIDIIEASIVEDTGQTMRSTMSDPCPFCGGEPFMQVRDFGSYAVESRTVCGRCHVATAWDGISWRIWHEDREVTRTIAVGYGISRWNRRAERTCSMVDNGCELCCSECDGRCGWDDEPAYCPNCGAKVVNE